MKKGNVVYNEYHNIRRYGIIEKKVVENDGWAYCDVLWFNDDKYETAMADRKKLTNKDWSLQRYRSDQLKLINIETELNTLEGIRHHLNNWSDTHDKPDS
tara:strand:+ start:7470 stop:7769 length:300 start_codon:yes stop_codon:yes gene_type:complete